MDRNSNSTGSDSSDEPSTNLVIVKSSIAVVHRMFVIWRAIVAVIRAAVSVLQYVDHGEMNIGDHSVNPLVPNISCLENVASAHVTLFRINTGFLPSEFESWLASSAR